MRHFTFGVGPMLVATKARFYLLGKFKVPFITAKPAQTSNLTNRNQTIWNRALKRYFSFSEGAFESRATVGKAVASQLLNLYRYRDYVPFDKVK